MRNGTLLAIGAGLLIVGVLGLAFVTSTAATDDRTSPAEPGRASGADAMFIEQMIPHHDDAIAMAELAADEAEHGELRELAADIARNQSEENERMRGWYEDWFGGEVPEGGVGTGMGGPMMGGQTDLDELADAEPFDRVFIEQMIPHHRMGIMMAQMIRSRTAKPELRELADDIIESQSEEIDRMLEWYAEWYGQ